MLPEAPTTTSLQYAVAKHPKAMDIIKHLSASQRDVVNDAIDSFLSLNPRPPGHTVMHQIGQELVLEYTFGAPPSRYRIVYAVDDQKTKFTVLAVQEIRFSN